MAINLNGTGSISGLSSISAPAISGVPAGSASAPAFSFNGDSNTGLYSPGADQVAISTGGSGRLFVDASGNVGVGGSVGFGAIDHGIHVTGSGAQEGIRLQTSAGSSGILEVYAESGGATLDTRGSGYIRFNNATTEWARFDSSGRLGIGTSSPSQRLTVAGNILTTSAAGTDSYVNVTTTGVQNTYLGFNNSGSTNSNSVLNNYSYVGAGNAYGLQLLANGTPAVTIDTSQRVGIGTTTPNQALEVVGSQWLRGAYTDTTALGFVGNSGTGRDFVIKRSAASTMSVEMSGRNAFNIVGNTGNTNCEITFSTTGASEAVRIDSSSRLLVGTSTAREFNSGWVQRLQVEGSGASQAEMASITYNDNGGTGPALVFGKTRGTASGSVTAVQNNDVLGKFRFFGANGTNLTNEGAAISVEVDGTPFSSGDTTDLPGRIVFSTTADGASSPTERMRIKNTGQFQTYTTIGDAFDVAQGESAGTSSSVFVGRYGSTSNLNSGTVSIRIYNNGNIQNANNSYGALSDIKLKENIVDASSQWDDLKALQVRNYNFKEGQTHTQIGVVAQEVELVSPGLVTESPDRDAEGNDLGTVTKSVNYSVLYMKAVKALQEAMERIETLEAKVAALEAS